MNKRLAKYQYFIIQKLRREKVFWYLKELEESQWYSLEKLKSLQFNRLKSLLHNAYRNIPYYRRVFDEIGITPNDFRSMNDYCNFPVLSKSILKGNKKTP